jgi:hypothetical protein
VFFSFFFFLLTEFNVFSFLLGCHVNLPFRLLLVKSGVLINLKPSVNFAKMCFTIKMEMPINAVDNIMVLCNNCRKYFQYREMVQRYLEKIGRKQRICLTVQVFLQLMGLP